MLPPPRVVQGGSEYNGFMKPITSPLFRRLVIRGDFSALGVVMLLAAPVAAIAAGTSGLWLYGLAVLLAAGGVASWSFGRRSYRALLQEAAERHGGGDPGPSPVSWLSDAVWRRRNTFDPLVDAPNILLAEVDPMVKAPGEGEEQAVVKPVLRPVMDNERDLVSTEEADSADAAPQGSPEKLLALLAGTPGRFVGVSMRWPVCCGAISTLTGIRSDGDSPAGTFLPSADTPGDWGTDVTAGEHRFQCRRCGRRYATDPAW